VNFLVGLSSATVCACLSLAPAGAAERHPDFTGVWTNYHDPNQPAGAAFRRGAGPDLPFTDPAKAKVAAYRALVGPTEDNPGAHCLGTGMPGSMQGSGGYPMEIIQRPEQVTIIYEAHTEVRRLYLGDRNIGPYDRISDRNGYSSAHWEGDTLVVDTDNLKEQVDQRMAHSDRARIVERYHFDRDAKGAANPQILVAEMTMTDPVFYTQPVSAVKKWSIVPNGHVLPYQCDEQTWEDRLEELRTGKKVDYGK
jgi:hypothetical protein